MEAAVIASDRAVVEQKKLVGVFMSENAAVGSLESYAMTFKFDSTMAHK